MEPQSSYIWKDEYTSYLKPSSKSDAEIEHMEKIIHDIMNQSITVGNAGLANTSPSTPLDVVSNEREVVCPSDTVSSVLAGMINEL